MEITYASDQDYQYIFDNDNHIPKDFIQAKIIEKQIILVKDKDNKSVGWLRYGYFWDNIPFINMVYVSENYRNQGFGKELINFWEHEMKSQGFCLVMTSSLSNEKAQHFYRKLGYKDSGSLRLENEPLEIIFTKKL